MRIEITIGRDSKTEHAISGTLENGERFSWTVPRSKQPDDPQGWAARARSRLRLPDAVREARMTWAHAVYTPIGTFDDISGVRLSWEVPDTQEEEG